MSSWIADAALLFDPGDIHVFDAAADGDNYTDEGYIARFRLILAAIKQKKPLLTQYESGKGRRMAMHLLPQKLIYSQKVDKFRAMGRQLTGKGSKPVLLNLARIRELAESERPIPLQSTAGGGMEGNKLCASPFPTSATRWSGVCCNFLL